MNERARSSSIAVKIAAGFGLAVVGLLLRGLAPELVRYFRIRRM